MSRSHGGCVIDAVADQKNPATLAAQLVDCCDFVSGKELGLDAVNADTVCQSFGCGLVVSGQ